MRRVKEKKDLAYNFNTTKRMKSYRINCTDCVKKNHLAEKARVQGGEGFADAGLIQAGRGERKLVLRHSRSVHLGLDAHL